MRKQIILIVTFFVLLFSNTGCVNNVTKIHHPTASYKPWRYYKNYKPFHFWHHPRRGGAGYYMKPRHRYYQYPHRSPNHGWYQKNGYSK